MRKPSFLTALLLSVFLFSHQAAAGQETLLPKVETYDELVHAIRETRAASQARIEAAVEQEKVREAWETGKLIDTHILFQKKRAKYGEEVLERLADDLKTSRSELSFMLQFARAYPIFSPAKKFIWSHYRELFSLNDPKARTEVEEEAVRQNWGRDRVREEVRRRKAASSLSSPNTLVGDPDLPEITPGPLYTYQMIRLKDELKIDLGFGLYHDLAEKDAKKFKEGDILSVRDVNISTDGTWATGPKYIKAEGISVSDLFTYSALVTQVVDGDTFHALIDLGFGNTFAQRVRLRRIDAPELVSAEGKEAKAYLEKILARDKGRILMKSVDIDQHGRPIADVWVDGKSIDQEMLDKGLAVAVRD